MDIKRASYFRLLPWVLTALVLLAAGIFVTARLKAISFQVKQKPDPYQAFTSDVFDIVEKNYWKTLSQRDIANIYLLAAQKISGNNSLNLKEQNKQEVKALLGSILAGQTESEKIASTTELNSLVLANLEPFGRSALFTRQLSKELSNQVNNIDISTNLYNDLSVSKNATLSQIEDAYGKKLASLKNQSTPEAKKELAMVERAHEALKTPERKQAYDQSGQEPAVTYRQLNAKTFYIKISRFTPDLVSQFADAVKTLDGRPLYLNSLILDLRGNIGGAIDQMPQFLSAFLGTRANAFEYYSRGNYIPFSTQGTALAGLARFKKTAILTDKQTQSSAEVMAAALKKYKFGVLVGTPTQGWGTIERIFDIPHQISSQQYFSVYLVHTITLADDGRPIAGQGVLPQIDVQNSNWGKNFLSLLPDTSMLSEIKQLLD